MKKLSLEMLRLTSDEVLERSQMKKITGGYGTGNCSHSVCSPTLRCCSAHDYCNSAGNDQCVRRGCI
jgi:hypothetical protein